MSSGKAIGSQNGKTASASTEESEDERLVDLDSDEVDCTIIEDDDIDLEELMKQKVPIEFLITLQIPFFTENSSFIFQIILSRKDYRHAWCNICRTIPTNPRGKGSQ